MITVIGMTIALVFVLAAIAIDRHPMTRLRRGIRAHLHHDTVIRHYIER